MSLRLVGLGSAAGGDDQVGLLAAARLRTLLPSQVDITTDTTGGARLVALAEGIHTLVLLDAFLTTPALPPGTPQRWRYPDDRERLISTPLLGTHSISVPQGLELARTLDRLPQLVLIHALAIRNPQPGTPLSPELEQALRKWVQLIHNDVLQQLAPS